MIDDPVPVEPPLTLAEVELLEDGAEVIVLWSGGNGPYRYTVHVDKWGCRWAARGGHLVGEFNRPEHGRIGTERWHTRVWRAARDG